MSRFVTYFSFLSQQVFNPQKKMSQKVTYWLSPEDARARSTPNRSEHQPPDQSHTHRVNPKTGRLIQIGGRTDTILKRQELGVYQQKPQRRPRSNPRPHRDPEYSPRPLALPPPAQYQAHYSPPRSFQAYSHAPEPEPEQTPPPPTPPPAQKPIVNTSSIFFNHLSRSQW